MRLICPNCGAQYEVPDGVIPPQGRDVQCSNCGNTWFQPHPDNDPDLAEELDQDLPPTAPQDETDLLEEPEDSFDAPEPEPEFEPEFEPEPEADPEPAPQPSRRELDPSIAELLREEAEFEARHRASENPGLETQPDLGLEEPSSDEAARRALEARRRMASRRGMEEDQLTPQQDDSDDEGDPLEDHVSSRRELLPDIEEINSSLNADGRRPSRADDHVPGADTALPAPRPSGFRRGFALGLLVIVLAWALYVFSGQIAAKVPQLAQPLEQYTRTVDKGRLWLDSQTKALLVKLDAMAAASEK